MGGSPPRLPDGFSPTAAELIAAARREDVLSIVSWGVQQQGRSLLPPAAIRSFATAAREDALVSMLLESETKIVLAAMAATNTPSLLLKGSALAYWAYPAPHLRACSDVDVLVPSRKCAEQVAAALCTAGLERRDTSGDLVTYELMCQHRISDAVQLEIDVHWRLANSPLFADTFSFAELMAESVQIPRLGTNARGLGPVHACLHACIHRALNLSIGTPDKLKWLYDLEILMRLFTPADWQRLTAMAVSKKLAGVTLDALTATCAAFCRELPDYLADELSCAELAESVQTQRLADWRYMQRKTFQSLPTMHLRMRWLFQRLFPSRDYLRYVYGNEHKTYVALLVIRIVRAVKRLKA
jgi:Uncharacterised nucleotidyltransferase